MFADIRFFFVLVPIKFHKFDYTEIYVFIKIFTKILTLKGLGLELNCPEKLNNEVPLI